MAEHAGTCSPACRLPGHPFGPPQGVQLPGRPRKQLWLSWYRCTLAPLPPPPPQNPGSAPWQPCHGGTGGLRMCSPALVRGPQSGQGAHPAHGPGRGRVPWPCPGDTCRGRPLVGQMLWDISRTAGTSGTAGSDTGSIPNTHSGGGWEPRVGLQARHGQSPILGHTGLEPPSPRQPRRGCLGCSEALAALLGSLGTGVRLGRGWEQEDCVCSPRSPWGPTQQSLHPRRCTSGCMNALPTPHSPGSKGWSG